MRHHVEGVQVPEERFMGDAGDRRVYYAWDAKIDRDGSPWTPAFESATAAGAQPVYGEHDALWERVCKGLPGVATGLRVEGGCGGEVYDLPVLQSCAACQVKDRLASEAERLRADNARKDALLRDGLHRIKNNLQTISALLAIEVSRMHDDEDVRRIKDVQQRIRSIALVHESQYLAQEVGTIDFGEYAARLARDILLAYRTDDRGVDVHCDVERVEMDADIAIPCGLILTELVANALKHAFPDGRCGSIEITVKRDGGDGLLLRVADDGIGLNPEVEPDAAASMGLTLVSMLCSQVGGSMEIDREAGTAFSLRCARKNGRTG